MDKNVYVILAIVLGVLLLVAVVAMSVIIIRKKKPNQNIVEDVKIIDGVRCTQSEQIATETGDVKVSIKASDIILQRGVTVVAKKDAALLPGKYTVLSSSDNVEKFNIRKGGFVREYCHGESIALAENESICPVSHTIILR